MSKTNLLKESLITNSELRKLNASSQAIATATANLAAIQAKQAEESQRQTAIMEAQLEVAKIAELERNRQNQIKQAAFSVDEKLSEIGNYDSNIKKYFFYKDQLNQVDYVNLTPDTPNEINDKKYVKEVLDKLHVHINEVRKSLSDKERLDVDSYYQYINDLYDAKDLAQSLEERVSGLVIPTALSPVKQIFAPRFTANNQHHFMFLIVYYLLIPGTYGLVLLLGLGSYFIFKKKFDNQILEVTNQRNVAIRDLENAKQEINRLTKFFADFAASYQLP